MYGYGYGDMDGCMGVIFHISPTLHHHPALRPMLYFVKVPRAKSVQHLGDMAADGFDPNEHKVRHVLYVMCGVLCAVCGTQCMGHFLSRVV